MIHDPICLKYLDLLIDFIKTIYKFTSQRLLLLLKTNKITFDLLWTLFKLNLMVYMTYFGTDKLWCVIYDDDEETKTRNRLKHYKIKCQYLDYNDQIFEDALFDLTILKFCKKRNISTLNAFPLQYHSDEKKPKDHLIKCDRKFVSILGTHLCHCRDTVFCMKDEEPFKVSVDSRVMLDTVFFRKMNPNYTRSRPDVLDKKKTDDDIFLEPSNERSLNQVKHNDVEPVKIEERDFLICCPIVSGFSFEDKVWSMIVSLLRYSYSYINSVINNGICRCRYKRHRIVLITFWLFNNLWWTEGGYYSLAETRLGLVSRVSFDDFITSKKRGFNVLL